LILTKFLCRTNQQQQQQLSHNLTLAKESWKIIIDAVPPLDSTSIIQGKWVDGGQSPVFEATQNTKKGGFFSRDVTKSVVLKQLQIRETTKEPYIRREIFLLWFLSKYSSY